MENIIEFPAKEAGANKTASEVELAQAVGNENVSTYGYQGVEKGNAKIIPFPGKKRPQITYFPLSKYQHCKSQG